MLEQDILYIWFILKKNNRWYYLFVGEFILYLGHAILWAGYQDQHHTSAYSKACHLDKHIHKERE